MKRLLFITSANPPRIYSLYVFVHLHSVNMFELLNIMIFDMNCKRIHRTNCLLPWITSRCSHSFRFFFFITQLHYLVRTTPLSKSQLDKTNQIFEWKNDDVTNYKKRSANVSKTDTTTHMIDSNAILTAVSMLTQGTMSTHIVVYPVVRPWHILILSSREREE